MAKADRLPALGTTPSASSYVALRTMQANRSRDTKPEVLVRSVLHRAGLRFRKDRRIVVQKTSVRADVVFPRQRLALFIDGCFWHGCPEHLQWPKANAAWWRAKIERNQTRDREVDAALLESGWTVVRAWEHEPPEAVLRNVQSALETHANKAQAVRSSAG